MDGANFGNNYEKRKSNRGNESTSERQNEVKELGVPEKAKKRNREEEEDPDFAGSIPSGDVKFYTVHSKIVPFAINYWNWHIFA